MGTATRVLVQRMMRCETCNILIVAFEIHAKISRFLLWFLGRWVDQDSQLGWTHASSRASSDPQIPVPASVARSGSTIHRLDSDRMVFPMFMEELFRIEKMKLRFLRTLQLMGCKPRLAFEVSRPSSFPLFVANLGLFC